MVLYNTYAVQMILKEGSKVEFCTPTTRLVTNGAESYLLTSIGKAPSWRVELEAEYPYFVLPDQLYWYSNRKDWSYEHQGQSCSDIARWLPGIDICAFNGDRTQFLFIGRGSLIGSGPSPQGPENHLLLCFLVTPKLSRTLWVRYGGYRQWLLIVGEDEFQIGNYQEAVKVLDTHWGPRAPDLTLTRYEGDVIYAAVNDRNEAVVDYQVKRGTSVVTSGCWNENGPWTSFGRSNADRWEVPVSTVIPRSIAMQMIEQFMSMRRKNKDCHA